MVNNVQFESNNPMTEVALESSLVDGREQKFRQVLVTDDAGMRHQVASVTQNYSLITNQVIHDAAVDVMSRSDREFEWLKTFWDGKRFIEYHRTTQPIVDGGLHMGVMFKNSYDGSSLAMLSIFILNAGCLNMYHSGSLFGSFEMRHSGDNSFDNRSIDDSLRNLQTGAESCIRIAPRIEELKRESIDVDDVVKAKQRKLLPDARWPDVIDALATEDRTQFGLFQSLTNVATHKLSDWHGHKHREACTEYFLTRAEGEETAKEKYYDKQHFGDEQLAHGNINAHPLHPDGRN